jgi:integrase
VLHFASRNKPTASKMAKQPNSKKLSQNVKSRSVTPIPNTIESIKGYPEKLVIFKVPASTYYWTRYYDGKTIKRSTGTESKAEAIKFAKAFYEDILTSKLKPTAKNVDKPLTTFMQCAEGVIAEDARSAKRGELSESYAGTQKQVIRNYITKYFNAYEISDVDFATLDDFKTFLYDKQLNSSSVKIHFSTLKKIFNYAQKHKLLKYAPLFPKVKREDNARGYFTLAEYWHLCQTARKLVGSNFEIKQSIDGGKSKKLRNVPITKELLYMIGFMVYTFIRPSDIKTIKHKHIELKREQTDSRDYEYLWMPIPETKKHSKALLSMPKAAYYYNKLVELKSKQGIVIDGEDYLFQPEQLNRDYAYKKLARQFDAVMKTAELKLSKDGDNRTLYSLRHTSLMYRLKYGEEISPIKLANNARTSVEMLTRFYLPQLENIEIKKELHAKKPSKKIKKQSKQFITFEDRTDLDINEVIRNSAKLPAKKLKLKGDKLVMDE